MLDGQSPHRKCALLCRERSQNLSSRAGHREAKALGTTPFRWPAALVRAQFQRLRVCLSTADFLHQRCEWCRFRRRKSRFGKAIRDYTSRCLRCYRVRRTAQVRTHSPPRGSRKPAKFSPFAQHLWSAPRLTATYVRLTVALKQPIRSVHRVRKPRKWVFRQQDEPTPRCAISRWQHRVVRILRRVCTMKGRTTHRSAPSVAPSLGRNSQPRRHLAARKGWFGDGVAPCPKRKQAQWRLPNLGERCGEWLHRQGFCRVRQPAVVLNIFVGGSSTCD